MPELDLSFRPRQPAAPTRLTAGRFALQFIRHPQVQLLLAFAAIAGLAAALTFGPSADGLKGALALLVVYPFAEYGWHRAILHNRIWVRWPLTARAWSVLHHWHHAHPTDTNALLPPPILPPLAATALSLPVGALAGGGAGMGYAFALGFLLVAATLYMHLGAHLVATPATGFGKAMRHRHMLHHFHDERRNFGTTTPLVDWLLGTSLTSAETTPRSPTCQTLGYDGDLAARYPLLGLIEAGKARPHF